MASVMPARKVAIVGFGTAGPAAALNIVRRLDGYSVDIFGKLFQSHKHDNDRHDHDALPYLC